MTEKSLKIYRWTARILGSIVFLLGLPFYVGYGWPIPRAEYSWWENMWLLIFPWIFIGLLIGWKWEMLAGFILTITIGGGLIVSIIVQHDPTSALLLPFIVGVLYLVYGFGIKRQKS